MSDTDDPDELYKRDARFFFLLTILIAEVVLLIRLLQ